MSRYHQKWDYVIDPHTAIGVGAAEKLLAEEEDVVCLSTAHPGKFQEPVEKALKQDYTLPEALSSLKDLPKKKEIIPASIEKVKEILLK